LQQLLLPTITTDRVEAVTASSARVYFSYTVPDAFSGNHQVGLVWSTSPNPQVSDHYQGHVSGETITGLTPNTTYYLKAVFDNGNNRYYYGQELTFTTLSAEVPTLTTTEVSNITSSTATTGGTITSNGRADTTARGLVWSTSPSPTTALATKTTDGTGTGTFTSTLTGLAPATTYYVRAYATNTAGTAYGNEVSFTTNAAAVLGALNCGSATNNGTLTQGTAASGVSSSVPYTGGNGGTHSGQTVTSTGVTGLTATLAAGTFANGAGTLTYTITGTPVSSGTASFAINIGGQTCTLSFTVANLTAQYPAGTVHCNPNNPTAIVDVTNPTTGKIWMDRNLGASQSATSSTDANAYGDLYQWGRRSDGHQCRTSPTTSTLSSTDQPAHGSFILAPSSPYDWRSPQNTNLWQGVSGTNNPCPSGYRLPTDTELDAERTSWSNNNAAGAFASPLKLPVAGYRSGSGGSLLNVGTRGSYWSSTVISTFSRYLFCTSSNAVMGTSARANGSSVRCLKD
jgi:uncharacterized protein (TIGR02145 family)